MMTEGILYAAKGTEQTQQKGMGKFEKVRI